jgi:hypothetical protein
LLTVATGITVALTAFSVVAALWVGRPWEVAGVFAR